ncbi:MAG: GNAT family N-acetyltransferase, partial [Candidatus Poribacteria bacterium]|nr:GNAT family N-acetyltransferase [Candidatus Poribacteria bacterium]
ESAGWCGVLGGVLPNGGSPTNVMIARVDESPYLEEVRRLFWEYAEDSKRLDGFVYCVENFEAEVNALPGEFAPPSGRLLVALRDDAVAGCVAIRRLEDGVCEMRRLYVSPTHRGHGVGRELAAAAVREAAELGYRAIRLDTLDVMTAANALYQSLGFRQIAPYGANRSPRIRYYELSLSRSG